MELGTSKPNVHPHGKVEFPNTRSKAQSIHPRHYHIGAYGCHVPREEGSAVWVHIGFVSKVVDDFPPGGPYRHALLRQKPAFYVDCSTRQEILMG